MTGARVVAALDRAAGSDLVAVRAAEQARRMHAGLLLLHVSPWVVEDDRGPVLRDLAAATELAMRVVADQLVAAGAGRDELEVAWRVCSGEPAEMLVAAAGGARMVVAGRRSGRAPGMLLLGSVGAALRERCPVPLLLVPTSPEVVPVGAPGPVVLGLDGRPDSAGVVDAAFAEADRRGAPLLAVHVWEQPAPSSAWLHPDGPLHLSTAAEDETRLTAEILAGHRARHPDVDVRAVVRHGSVADSLLGAATSAQLLVVGRRPRRDRGHRGTGAVLGRRTPCPLLVQPVG
ncbi:universal stress protein [Klenkia sp. LSe6-5]|uniref:Universal stress protein n=1 Tax=Klenkia sesuvii TaxID=3103137 RepID=A0ABU8DTJ4_9ACTN